MCIYHCLPLVDYTCDVVSPVYTKVNSTDYAIPEFDRVGMESLPLSRLVNASSSVVPYDHHLLGYVPRYIDYKTDIDTSVGAFKTTLKNWIISYNNDSIMEQLVSVTGSDPEVLSNYTSFKVNPNSVNPLFAVEVNDSVDTDNFLCTSFFDVKVVRNLDTDGLPY